MRSSHWGEWLLAGVGTVLVLAGLTLLSLPFVAQISALIICPGFAVLGLGVLLVVLSAYYDSSTGGARLLGWRISFGEGTADLSRSEIRKRQAPPLRPSEKLIAVERRRK